MKQSFLFFFLFLITVIPFHANADLLNSAVRIKAQIPEKARTSKFLGKEREGSGIVIDDEGHVLTIGYLVLEAGSVEITDVDGRVIAAAVEGYDGDSGFGLLKALSPLQARPLRLSDSSDIQSEERLRVVSSQDDTVVQQVVVLNGGLSQVIGNTFWKTQSLPYPRSMHLPVQDWSTRRENLSGSGPLFFSEISSRLWYRATCSFRPKLCCQSWMI